MESGNCDNIIKIKLFLSIIGKKIFVLTPVGIFASNLSLSLNLIQNFARICFWNKTQNSLKQPTYAIKNFNE